MNLVRSDGIPGIDWSINRQLILIEGVVGYECFAKKFEFGKSMSLWARSIQPKFRPVRPGKVDHLKRWTCFSETFPVGPNRSIEFWTEISGNFGWMDRALWVIQRQYTQSVILNDNVHGLSANTWAYLSRGLPKSAGRFSEVAEYFS